MRLDDFSIEGLSADGWLRRLAALEGRLLVNTAEDGFEENKECRCVCGRGCGCSISFMQL